MQISTNTLALDALAVVVTFGVGFLLWTLAHLFREGHSGSGARTQPFEPRTPRH